MSLEGVEIEWVGDAEGVGDAGWVAIDSSGTWVEGEADEGDEWIIDRSGTWRLPPGLKFEDQPLADALFIEVDEAMSHYTAALDLSERAGEKAGAVIQHLQRLRLCDLTSGVCGSRNEWVERAEEAGNDE
ncbi:MAG: hypothetical protein V3V08_05605 [Nannocystaceae bacterium]